MDQSIWELMNHGFGAMWVVLAFSVIALAVGIERAIAQWKFVTRARVDSSPVLVGNRVFVGSSDGKLYSLDAQSGEKRWEYEIGDALTATPAVAGGRLVIGAQDGRIYCFG